MFGYNEPTTISMVVSFSLLVVTTIFYFLGMKKESYRPIYVPIYMILGMVLFMSIMFGGRNETYIPFNKDLLSVVETENTIYVEFVSHFAYPKGVIIYDKTQIHKFEFRKKRSWITKEFFLSRNYKIAYLDDLMGLRLNQLLFEAPMTKTGWYSMDVLSMDVKMYEVN